MKFEKVINIVFIIIISIIIIIIIIIITIFIIIIIVLSSGVQTPLYTALVLQDFTGLGYQPFALLFTFNITSDTGLMFNMFRLTLVLIKEV